MTRLRGADGLGLDGVVVDGDWPADWANRVRNHLASGGVLAVATESSYGLAADPRSVAGVEAIYRMKERDRGKPLPVVVADLEQLALLGVDVDLPALQQVGRHWPAPLTVIVPAEGPDGPWPAAAGGATLAARVPAHEGLRKLLSAVGLPLTATSANVAGEPAISNPETLMSWTADHPLWIVDDGVAPGGAPSTIVQLSAGEWRLVRQGRFPFHQLVETGH